MRFKTRVLTAAISASIITLSGCSTNTHRTSELENELRLKEQENQELRISLASMKGEGSTVDRVPAAAPAAVATASGDLLPPDARSGECYARVWVPAKYRDLTKQVLVREEGERVEIIPAEYRWEEETVLVKDASSRIEQVPPVYGTENETIKVKDAWRGWKVSLDTHAAPASQELLAAAKAHGIDLDAAEPGMCFHEHYVPARFKTEEQRVLVSEGSEKVDVSAAKYRWVEKRILVQEASSRMEEVPAVYQWEEERVIDKPAHTIWKKGTGPIQRIDESTGEIMCLVEVPATYKTIKKRVLVTPATTRKVEVPAEYKTVKVRELEEDASERKLEIPPEYKTVKVTNKVADAQFTWHEIHNMEHPASTRTGHQICLVETPAKYKTVERRVVKTPATTRKVEVPAEYKIMKVRKLVSEPQEKRIKIPAEYNTVTLKELERDGYMEWRSILCETNMTDTRITQIQRALRQAGYDPGPVDGIIGDQTMVAVNAFQRDKGLPVDKYLNVATLEALGVSSR